MCRKNVAGHLIYVGVAYALQRYVVFALQRYCVLCVCVCVLLCVLCVCIVCCLLGCIEGGGPATVPLHRSLSVESSYLAGELDSTSTQPASPRHIDRP